MRASHTMGTAGDDAEKPRLTSFYIAKGKELNDPMNPESGETGNLIYSMSETYAAPTGIAKHMELATKDWPGMASLPEKAEKYGVFMHVGAASVFTNFKD